MSLTGSLETFSLPDVLALLASSKKTGELSIDGERAQGRLWVEKGRLTGHEVGRSADPVDALFELLRLPAGTFAFEADRAAADPIAPVDVAGIVDAAQARLGEWRSIEKVVPSLDAEVRMAGEAPEAEVIIRSDQWLLLVAAAGGRSVSSMMDETGLGEFDCCRAIKELVEGRLLEISVAAKPQPKPQARRPERPRQPRADAPADDEPESSRPIEDLDSLVEIPGRLRGQASAPAAAPRAQAAPAAAERPERTERAERPERPERADRAERAEAAAAPAAAGTETVADEELLDELSDEPINRGLLLKFLSSVKN